MPWQRLTLVLWWFLAVFVMNWRVRITRVPNWYTMMKVNMKAIKIWRTANFSTIYCRWSIYVIASARWHSFELLLPLVSPDQTISTWCLTFLSSARMRNWKEAIRSWNPPLRTTSTWWASTIFRVSVFFPEVSSISLWKTLSTTGFTEKRVVPMPGTRPNSR